MIEFWAADLALALLLYVLLDGFDIGVGILFPFAPNETARRGMLAAISPVWDGNETWLVIAGTVLFGAFPVVYSLLLSAFYLPFLVMLSGLILRGVAFEYRYKTVRFRWLWDTGFVLGSYAAAFVQGAAIGALVQGVPVANHGYAGGPFTWLTPFALACGAGLCIGYAALGSCWLAGKTGGDVRAFSRRMLPILLLALLAFLVFVFAYASLVDLPVLRRWSEKPVLFLFPLLAAGALVGLLVEYRKGADRLLFVFCAALFVAAFATLAVSFLPYMVPFSITIAEAAAPASSLRFLFWGAGLFVLPLTLAYTAAVYFIFRGRAPEDAGYH